MCEKVCVHTCIGMCLCVRPEAGVCIFMFAHMYIRGCICEYACVKVCLYVLCTCMCTCMTVCVFPLSICVISRILPVWAKWRGGRTGKAPGLALSFWASGRLVTASRQVGQAPVSRLALAKPQVMQPLLPAPATSVPPAPVVPAAAAWPQQGRGLLAICPFSCFLHCTWLSSALQTFPACTALWYWVAALEPIFVPGRSWWECDEPKPLVPVGLGTALRSHPPGCESKHCPGLKRMRRSPPCPSGVGLERHPLVKCVHEISPTRGGQWLDDRRECSLSLLGFWEMPCFHQWNGWFFSVAWLFFPYYSFVH